jgi:hypothetical protein
MPDIREAADANAQGKLKMLLKDLQEASLYWPDDLEEGATG